jgi:hypothetical protein
MFLEMLTILQIDSDEWDLEVAWHELLFVEGEAAP